MDGRVGPRLAAGDPYRGGTYAYFNLTQNVNGEIRTLPRALLDRRARRADPTGDHRLRPRSRSRGSCGGPRSRRTTGHRSSRTTRRVTPRTGGDVTTWVTPARPDWVKGRFDHRVTHGAGTPPTGSAEADTSDKPRYLRRLPELTPEEKAAETEVTRQRAESLFVLDVQIGHTISRLSASGQLANTVIMFTSDNGYYLGEHRKRQGKINLHEPSLRVPLIIAGRRFRPAGATTR